jgi:hypothetical protein
MWSFTTETNHFEIDLSAGTLIGMIEEDLIAERVAIDRYREMIGYLGNDDSTTRQMLGEILAMEEEHAEDSVSLLKELGARFTLGGRKCDSLPSSSRRRASGRRDAPMYISSSQHSCRSKVWI